MFPLSMPYRDSPLPAYFGTTTSRANFCEEDFIITGYIAEFVNTLTNLSYILYAVQNLRRLQRENGPLSSKMIYYSLMFVGVTSGLFHALLKYYAQMGDDVSMLVASACVLQRAVTFDKSPEYTRKFGTALFVTLSTAIIYHCVTDEVVVHQLAFLILLVSTGMKTRALIKTRAKSQDIQKRLSTLSIFGASSFVTGYILWQIDENFCPQLTATKRYLGLPWGFLFELHGWWHILTAIGAYTFMAMVEQLTNERGVSLNTPFSWPLEMLTSEGVDLSKPAKKD